MENHEIMTVEEVAAYVRVSERTVYDWAQKGEIPCGKLGSTWRFRRSDINEWVNTRLGGSVKQKEQAAAISLSRLLQPENVVMLKNTNKTAALDRLLQQLCKAREVLNPKELREGIYHREELMSTGIGLGIGVPHVRLKSVTDITVALGVSTDPVEDYAAIDNLPVHLIFMIAARHNQHPEHLRLLSSISSTFKEDAHRKRLLAAPDSEAVFQTIQALAC
jgi:PTS system nitrogen regulatory IIA component